MGVGPNYVLDKGFVATGSTAYAQGELVTASGDGTKCARATGAGARVLGVCQESVDATRVTTGKVVLDVRLLGISRVLAGAAVAVGDRVTNDATARAVAVAASLGLKESFGVALTASTAAGQFIDVLLTPAATVNTAVS
jgi:hypothetical protein